VRLQAAAPVSSVTVPLSALFDSGAAPGLMMIRTAPTRGAGLPQFSVRRLVMWRRSLSDYAWALVAVPLSMPAHIAFPALSYYCRIAVDLYSWRLHRILGHYRSGNVAAD
jgi:hypothetical protein